MLNVTGTERILILHFLNLEFLLVWSVNAFKSRKPADETTTAISCCLWGILCSSFWLPFITLCSLKRADIPTNMRQSGPYWIWCIFLTAVSGIDPKKLWQCVGSQGNQRRALSERRANKYRLHISIFTCENISMYNCWLRNNAVVCSKHLFMLSGLV